jgi:ribosomal-protein-alanine N-acetyltransferase
MHAIDNVSHNDQHMVRQMVARDLPAVVWIEEQCHDFDAWPSKLFEDCFAAGFPAFIVEEHEQVRGFVMASIAADEMQILNIKVAPDFQRQGLASTMLTYCIELARQQAITRIFLEVRISNIIAQHLYEKFGFFQNGVRTNYYSAGDGAREDAFLYCLEIS